MEILLTDNQEIYKIKVEYKKNIVEILNSLDKKIENKITLNYIKRMLETSLNKLFN